MSKIRVLRKYGKRWMCLLLTVSFTVSLTACVSPEHEEIDPGYSYESGNEIGDDEVVPQDDDFIPYDGRREETGMTQTSHVIRTAVYPEMVKYPNYDDFNNDWDKYDRAYEEWRNSRNSLNPENEDYKTGLMEYCTATIKEFIGSEDGQNKVYSPINVYMALGMLAELTDGNSRAQILELMQVESIEALRSKITDIWKSTYADDGSITTILGSSLWMNQNISYVEETMETLKDIYYASSYQGQMGSAEYNKMLQDWLNEQTGGLLSEQAEGVEMDPATVLALATTIYFKGSWKKEFSEQETVEKTFHGAKKDVICDFMRKTETQTVYAGDNFTAIAKSFLNGGSMYLFLPDKGKTAEELLQSEDLMELVFSPNDWKDQKTLRVNLELPKFDVVSDKSLVDGLKNLGVTDVFDYRVSDFTPTTTDLDELFVSKVLHAARVKVDEEGCEAAAYTVMMVENTFMFMGDEIDLVLDRPFVFVITGRNGLPLFTGVVNQP